MTDDPNRSSLRQQATALREAAAKAGARAAVPTCPEWDVLGLVRHLGRVYAMVGHALTLTPEDSRPRPDSPPRDFDAALNWMEERLAELDRQLAEDSPDRVVWSFFPGGSPRSWTRRMAHETAVHRLDAEYALSNGAPDTGAAVFDPEFAADGVDEFLTVLLGVGHDWSGERMTGRLLFHAVDVERAWLVTFEAGRLPTVRRSHPTDFREESPQATVTGAADAVYRRVWGRPSTAALSGDHELAGLVSGR
ncbi:maleylpyruvate isomerase family mycothiol-dependent enzyme [Actinopolyspora erythraea]|uniref:Maleylpyruvate isomerase family mycothiol-dependent enzyme n=1 Tax=Actinopolyspora erythraea TaxID=414996 RepID=A0A099D977_9ACTN|nr:maleylpyruvate isomerase N-terminal domain-containing protein [Actinopolyspora erythraea]ASU80341.1 maleylpyruvate isomerase family mycothiol-dependent enzyme [Actinopolyspora erythraea]KGI82579.1 hypothetical protein IL38_03855 [Actinopolyspora erythraea]